MKFKNYLESITGVEIYPMISLMLFFLFFTVLIYFVVKADKNKIAELAQIPLDENESNNNNNSIQKK